MNKTAALIVAAGRGTRAGGDGRGPKQFERIGGAPVLTHTLRAFCEHTDIDLVQVVIHTEDGALYREAAGGRSKLQQPCAGGATRQASVLAGLEALAPHAPDNVLIHDAARPFVSPGIIERVIAALVTRTAAIAAVAVADTLKRAGSGGIVAATVERTGLWGAQTPQGFHFAAILDAHRRAAKAGRSDFTDDASIAEWAGIPVAIVEGSSDNMKITTGDDLTRADRMMSAARILVPRTGLGFDVHAFAPGDHLWLGGVAIPHTHKLDGHSDADVVLHALTDALLGAIGDGDIGQHFPPSDPQWKGVASILFLKDAVRRVHKNGGRVVNVDVTVLAEAPKIGPHREAMQAVIAGALGCEPRDVGIKATTTETLGFVGRREGIAAMAVATVVVVGFE